MDSHVCYDLIPYTSKLVVFDTQLTVNKHCYRCRIKYVPLFHRRTRASYVYNGCLAWYNVVLTHGSTQA